MKPRANTDRLESLARRIEALRQKAADIRIMRESQPESDWKTNARWRGIRKNP